MVAPLTAIQLILTVSEFAGLLAADTPVGVPGALAVLPVPLAVVPVPLAVLPVPLAVPETGPTDTQEDDEPSTPEPDTAVTLK